MSDSHQDQANPAYLAPLLSSEGNKSNDSNTKGGSNSSSTVENWKSFNHQYDEESGTPDDQGELLPRITTDYLAKKADDNRKSAEESDLLNKKEGQLYEELGTSSTSKSLTRTRCIYCSVCTFIVLAVMLPVIFLIIIPNYIKSVVDKSDIIIDSASINYPADQTFQSSVMQRFSEKCPVRATVQMHEITLSWNGEGGGAMVQLSHANQVRVVTAAVNVHSTATVLNHSAFAAFNKYALSHESFEWQLSGYITLNAIVPTTVYINKPVILQGFNNFRQPPVVTKINITHGWAEGFAANIDATLISPSNVVILFGQDLMFTVKSFGIPVGIGRIPNCQLLKGEFNISSTINLQPNNAEESNQLMKVLTNFSMGIPSPVTMEEFYTPASVKWLVPGLLSMKLYTFFPGVVEKLLWTSDLYVTTNPLKGVPFTVGMFNAIDTPIHVTKISAVIYTNNVAVGTVEMSGLYITIPPRQQITSPMLMAMPILAGYSELTKLLQAGSGILFFTSTLGLDVDLFPSTIQYYQDNLPTFIHKG